MTFPLYLMRLVVDLSALAQQADERGWVKRKGAGGREVDVAFDEGRALHHILTETFGPQALQPFRLMVAPRARTGRLYAYSRHAREALLQQANVAAQPETERALRWRDLEAREMPSNWRAGQRIGFDLRARPIRRIGEGLADAARDISFAKGAELDAFRVEMLRRFPNRSAREGGETESEMEAVGRTREAVYSDWLAERLAGAAELVPETVRLVRFQRVKTARGDQAIEGPDAVLQGELLVQDPSAFSTLLGKGVGRHRAYGYGMLLLRPARMSAPKN